MDAVCRRSLWSLSLAGLLFGCDRADPLHPEIDTAASGGGGSSLAAPSGAAAAASSHDRIDVSWQDNSSGETGFEVHRATGATGPFTLRASTAVGVTSYADVGLTHTTEFCYRIRVLKVRGFRTTYSEFSAVACATTLVPPLPAAPSGANASLTASGTVAITWADNASTEDGFRVERSLDGGATWETAHLAGANATMSIDYGRTPEELVCYRILAFNTQGDSPPSNTDCITPPAAPTNLTAAAVDPQTIELRWMDNSAVEEGYEVQRYDGITAYTTIANLPANSATYRDAGVTSDITYRYIVRARKDGGLSAPSNVASAAAATAPPSAPSGTEATPWGSWVSVAWTDNSPNEDGFRIERSTDGGVTWSTVAIATYGFSDGPLPTEQRVCYRVYAFNGLGESPPSSIDCTTPPADPANLTASWGDGTIDLAWTDNSAVEDGYDVVMLTTCLMEPEVWLDRLPPNATSYRHYGWEDWWLPAGCYAYGYYVVATSDGGYSDRSNVAAP